MTSPEIPDSVSPDLLKELLHSRGGIPTSDVMPELNLGGPDGAPCDLQFAIKQLVMRSTSGSNFIQLLVAATHLLLEAEDFYANQLRSQLPDDGRKLSAIEAAILAEMSDLNRFISTAIHNLQVFTEAISYPFWIERAKRVKSELPKGFATEEFHSHLLISDALLASLEIDRTAITAYLKRLITSKP